MPEIRAPVKPLSILEAAFFMEAKIMQDTGILRPPKAAEYLGVSLRQLYNIAESDDDFPRKLVFSPRCVGYRRQSLDAWLQRKEQQAGGAAA